MVNGCNGSEMSLKQQLAETSIYFARDEQFDEVRHKGKYLELEEKHDG